MSDMNDQAAIVIQALEQYEASITNSFIQRKGKVLPVKIVIKKNRLLFVAPSGTLLGSGSISTDTVENFVESFWMWKKEYLVKR